MMCFSGKHKISTSYALIRIVAKAGGTVNKKIIGVVDPTHVNLATLEDRRYNIDKWAKLFKAQTWEDIKMLAAQDINISAAATTLYQLSEDERIQQECEAREDYLLREQDLADRIAEREQIIAEREQTIAEQQQALADKDNEIARLKELLAEKAK
ncbi:MAG: hypothetical protein K6E50_07935 [Lachnospiraceae bacterium]|nr:hypothetical protein [Lachnospiraceae bacterium]